MHDYTDLAESQLQRLKALTAQTGHQWVDLAPTAFGVGGAIGQSETRYVVASIMGGGSENQVWLTGGVLRDVTQDRLTVLDACNRHNQSSASYPVFLHDAELGWDVIMQLSFPLQLLLDVPPFYSSVLAAIPDVVDEVRAQLSEDPAIGGTEYQWNAEDLARLLLRGMI